MSELATWQKQPDGRAVVWQHNQLAEARYELTAREQKLLLYVVSMIEAEDDELKRYVVNIAEFAELAKLDKDHLYQELRELAANLKRKALIIPNHYDSLTGRYVDLVTSWFDSAMIGRNGSGYFAVTISPQLRPYLLQVKREFFRFRLVHVMQMRSAYAIRLYQWLKRWEFRRVVEVSVADLRVHMGAVGFDEKGKRKENLALYPDFKRWAIKPAVNEINDHKDTDLRVSFEEIKAKGSRAVERLRFRMASLGKESPGFSLPEPQPELLLGDVEQLHPDLIDELAARYGLNEKQRQKVANYQDQKGIEYLRQKVVVVEQQPRKNSAAAFLAALRDDWQPAVEMKKAQRQKKEKDGEVEERRQISVEEAKEAAKALRELRASLA